MASLPGAFFEKGRSFLPCLFNSFDPYFKQPFGAVRAGQSVHLSLCIPEELGYVDPHLVLQKEGRYDVPVHYRMKFDGQTPHQNHFSVDVTLNDVGLYFYYFDLYTNFRRIVRGPDNCGIVSWQEGESWQITVYEADFETPDPIKGKVFYQIFPDRFCEGVENKPMPFPDRLYQADKHAEPFWQPNEVGGHLNEDYFGGDLRGIQMKLPYLREMGVDYLYLNPIFEAHSNHRYNTADYLNVDPLLGTNEDFETLCAEARKYGIGIVLDGVFSHTGSDSRYFNREGRYSEAVPIVTPTPPTAAGTISTPGIRTATAAGGASRPCPKSTKRLLLTSNLSPARAVSSTPGSAGVQQASVWTWPTSCPMSSLRRSASPSSGSARISSFWAKCGRTPPPSSASTSAAPTCWARASTA